MPPSILREKFEGRLYNQTTAEAYVSPFADKLYGGVLMNQQFDQIENALSTLETLVSELKLEKEQFKRDIEELKGIVDDRDLEILQLQEDAEKRKQECEGEKAEISNRLQMLLGRVQLIGAEENKG